MVATEVWLLGIGVIGAIILLGKIPNISMNTTLGSSLNNYPYPGDPMSVAFGNQNPNSYTPSIAPTAVATLLQSASASQSNTQSSQVSQYLSNQNALIANQVITNNNNGIGAMSSNAINMFAPAATSNIQVVPTTTTYTGGVVASGILYIPYVDVISNSTVSTGTTPASSTMSASVSTASSTQHSSTTYVVLNNNPNIYQTSLIGGSSTSQTKSAIDGFMVGTSLSTINGINIYSNANPLNASYIAGPSG